MIDVARKAGVSHMTVSRYLNDQDTVRQAKRESIEAAIEELGYRPNIVARSMRTRRSGLLSLLLPSTINPFSPARLISAAALAAHGEGFEVEIVQVDGGAKARTAKALELADSQLVGGVLSLGSLDLDSLAGAAAAVPIVEFEVFDDHLRGVGPLLRVDPVPILMKRLRELGHRHVFHVGGPERHPASDHRQAAYEKMARELGMQTHGVVRGPWTGRTGLAAVESLSDDTRVTAVVCSNDELAAGVMQGAQARGWSVPERMSVTGWDDNSLAAFLSPPLTTVAVAHERLGVVAVQRLLAEIRGKDAAGLEIPSLNSVVWRGSVGPVPEGFGE